MQVARKKRKRDSIPNWGTPLWLLGCRRGVAAWKQKWRESGGVTLADWTESKLTVVQSSEAATSSATLQISGVLHVSLPAMIGINSVWSASDTVVDVRFETTTGALLVTVEETSTTKKRAFTALASQQSSFDLCWVQAETHTVQNLLPKMSSILVLLEAQNDDNLRGRLAAVDSVLATGTLGGGVCLEVVDKSHFNIAFDANIDEDDGKHGEEMSVTKTSIDLETLAKIASPEVSITLDFCQERGRTVVNVRV